MDIRGNNFPHTYGDKNGHLIDWSGYVGVSACLEPGCATPNDGPFFTVDDTRQGAVKHRHQYHSAPDDNGKKLVVRMSPEAIEASTERQCMDCTKRKAHARGLCNPCTDKRKAAWLREQGLMTKDETYTAYLGQLAPTYTSPRWANYKPKEKE